jgi:starvation-inducible DNA-binding protein
MNAIKTDLKESAVTVSIALLNPALASATDLLLDTKEAHWNLRGPNFMALHLFFDTLYSQVGVYVDDLAERIIQMGGHAHGTLRAAAKDSTLPAYPDNLHAEKDHLHALIVEFVAFSTLIRKDIDAADEGGDKDTADLFTQISRGLDKQIWFLEAHLG